MIGKTISHYKILEKLGEGGMGIVYKAEDTKLKRCVALKFLPHGLEAHEPERARFLHEARAASALNHPNVCTIFDIKEEGGQNFIVMEYVDGKTLRQLVPIQKIQDALTYAIQIGEALQEAHSNGVVHRDIKTDNIMVNTKNQIKVMDFGLAKLKGSLKLTKTSSTVGTLAYMAPEQIQGGEVDARSDIFSFGVVLYELLTGRLPFDGVHEAAMMYAILNEAPQPVQKYLPEVSSEVLHILNRALEKDPEDRYQSVHEMLIDLRRVKKQSTRVIRSAAWTPSPAGTQTDASLMAPASLAMVKRSLLKKPVIIIVAVLLLVLIATVLFKPLFRGGKVTMETYPFQSYKPLRMATTGQPIHAALSPDGKYIFYSVDEAGGQSVWMRQVNVVSNIRILPPLDINYTGFTFSPDGDYIYYTTAQRTMRSALFVIPTLGGTPRKLLDDIQSPVAVAPDGKQLAFLRQYYAKGEEALVVCSADGSNQRNLIVRKGEDFLVGMGGTSPSWSPEGTTIACPVGNTNGMYMSIMLVSLDDHSTRMATPFRWDMVSRVAWMSDGKGLMIVGREHLAGQSNQVWYLDLTSGQVHRLTIDLNNYDGATLSLTSDQTKLLVVQQNSNSSIFILPDGDSRHARQITSPSADEEGMSGLDWTPDRLLVFASRAGGNDDIWIMNADGSEKQQLTSNSYGEWSPSVSWDGKLITYISERDTTPHIWRMDIDGNNQKQLTTGALDDYYPTFSSDGQWIYFYSYRNNGRQNIWRVPVDGGDPKKVCDVSAYRVDISGDAQRIVTYFFDVASNRWRPAIISTESGKLLSFLDLPVTAGYVRWMPDGKAVAYIDTRNGVSNICVLPLESKKPYQLTHFDSQLIAEFVWSKDGKDLAIVRGMQTNEIVILAELR
jgi:serine/threonine protein kinase/Tol biopolymer transport system component